MDQVPAAVSRFLIERDFDYVGNGYGKQFSNIECNEQNVGSHEIL